MSVPTHRALRTHRVFAPEFKRDVCRQIAAGHKRPAQVCREHNIGEGLLLRWRRQFEQNGESAFEGSASSEAQSLEQKVAELERFCGQLSLENALLKKLVKALPPRNAKQTAPPSAKTIERLIEQTRLRDAVEVLCLEAARARRAGADERRAAGVGGESRKRKG